MAFPDNAQIFPSGQQEFHWRAEGLEGPDKEEYGIEDEELLKE